MTCTASDAAGNTATGKFNVVVNPASQVISFTPPPSTINFGVAPITLSATGGISGNQVTFSATGPATVSGNLLTITGAGTVVITADQEGNTFCSAAAPVSQTILVKPAAVTINWSTPSAITYGTPLTAVQLNASASTSGSFIYNPGLGTLLTAGPHTLSVSFSPKDSTDYAAVSAQVILQVNKATPALNWTPAPLQLGYPLGAAQLNATSSVVGSFIYTPPAGTIIRTSTQILSAQFSPVDAADYNQASINMPLTVTPAPLAAVSPTSIDFGTVYLGSITSRTVTVSNTGTSAMTISAPFISILRGGNSNEFVAINLCPSTLSAGKSCNISIQFIAGPFYTAQTATLNLKDNAPGSPQGVTMTAIVINPQVQLSATSVSFGKQKVNTISAGRTISVTNAGNTPLTLSKLSIQGSNATDFAESDNCSGSLSPKASCSITLVFKPMATGSRVATLTLTDNAQNSPQRVALSGTGN